jgi:hypothetical protein
MIVKAGMFIFYCIFVGIHFVSAFIRLFGVVVLLVLQLLLYPIDLFLKYGFRVTCLRFKVFW